MEESIEFIPSSAASLGVAPPPGGPFLLRDAHRAAAIAAGKQPLPAGVATADSAPTAALLAAKTEAAAAQEHVRAAALAWERERAAADALARQVAEAEHYLFVSSDWQPIVHFTDNVASSSHQALSAMTGPRPDPTDPMVAKLHLQAAGVQNIRALVSVLLDPASCSYGRWRDQVLLTLRCYALDDHVIVDSPIEARDVAWLRLDSVAMS